MKRKWLVSGSLIFFTLFLLGKVVWTAEVGIETTVEGTGYKNQIIHTNLKEVTKNGYCIMTYSEANEAKKPWSEIMQIDLAQPTFGSSMPLQLVKEAGFKNIINVRLQKKDSGGQFAAVDNVYTYVAPDNQIILIRSASAGEDKPNWVKLNGAEVKKIDSWPTNNVFLFEVKKGDRVELASPGWRPAVFIFERVDGMQKTEQKTSAAFPLLGLLYPSGHRSDRTIYLIEGEAERAFFPVWGRQKEKPALNQPKLVFEYPEGALNVKVFSKVGRGYSGYQPAACNISTFSKGGKIFSRCEVDLTDYLEKFYEYSRSIGAPMEFDFSYGHQFLVLEPGQKAPEEFTFSWYFRDADGRASAVETMPVKILSAIRDTDRPKYFGLLMWGGANEFEIPDEVFFQKRIALYKKLNIKCVVGRISGGKKVKDAGLQLLTHQGMEQAGFDGIMRDGTPAKVCFQKVVDNNYPMSEWLERYQDKTDPIYRENYSGMEFDFEPRPSDVSTYCFCDRCRQVFKERTGIDITKISPDEIIAKYKNEWVEFREWQYEQVLSAIYKMTKAIDPNWPLYLTSFYLYTDENQNRAWFEITGQDIKRFVKYCDYFMSMIYKDPLYVYDHVVYNIRNLKTNFIPIVHIDRAGDFDSPDIQSSNLVALDMLWAASLKVPMLGIYSGSQTDGEYFSAFKQALSLIAQCEDFYFTGEDITENLKISSPEKQAIIDVNGKTLAIGKDPLSGIRVRAHRLKGRYLVSIFNLSEGKENVDVQVRLPGLQNGSYVVQDKATGKFIQDSQKSTWTAAEIADSGILVSVAPMSARLLEFRIEPDRGKAVPKFESAITSTSAKTPVSGKKMSDVLKRGETTIQWTDMDGDSVPEVDISTQSQGVKISLAGGKLRFWKPNSASEELLRLKPETPVDVTYGVGACYDMVFMPKKARWTGDEKAVYDIINRSIDENGNARITLQRRMEFGPFKGAILTKEYLIYSSFPNIDVSVEVSDTSDPPQEMSFWVRNNTFVPNPADEKQSANRFVIRVPLAEKVATEKADKTLFYLTPGLTELLGFNDKSSGTLKEGWIEWQDVVSGDSVRYSFELDKVHQLYLCLPWTVEWMYRTKPMGFGSKFATHYSLQFVGKQH